MINELNTSIAISQAIVSLCSPFASAPSRRPLLARQTSAVTSIAASGIPRIDDSRVAPAMSSKLHSITIEHFRRHCLALQDLHPDANDASLRCLALQIKATYASLYERKVLECASRTHAHATKLEKQPFANDVLLYAYEKSPTPTRRQREVLASLTGLTVEQVRVWFQNRRSRTKRKAPEIQHRPALELHDVLERVRAARKAQVQSSVQLASEEFEQNDDSGYCSGVDQPSAPSHVQIVPRREVSSLAVAHSTARSYPAAYVPEPLTSYAHFDPPIWRRTPVTDPPANSSTVTVDELTRSMSRLTLQHYRQGPRAGSVGSCRAESATADAIPSHSARTPAASELSQKCTRVDPGTRRKVAGGRRAAASASTPSPSALLVSPAPLSSASTPGVSSATPPKTKKTTGPPRRPSGRRLQRQASDSSFASASSRSTSYASDFSCGSVTSDVSFTSVESAGAVGSPAQAQQQGRDPQCHDSNSRSTSHVQQSSLERAEQVPVYDLSSACDLSSLCPSIAFTALLDPAPLPCQGVQSEHVLPTTHSNAVHAQVLDVGMADMDAFLDFSSTAYPSLDALLSEPLSSFSIPPPPQPIPQPMSHTFDWHALGLGLPIQV